MVKVTVRTDAGADRYNRWQFAGFYHGITQEVLCPRIPQNKVLENRMCYNHMLSVLTGLFLVSVAQGRLFISCSSDSDLYQTLISNDIPCSRYANPTQAINRAASGAGVLILADGYPEKPTAIGDGLYTLAAQKKLRLYVEFPANLPQLDVGTVRSSRLERGVVADNVFGDTMAVNDLVIIHDCRLVEIDAPNPYLVLARVAGFDTAIYGLAGTATHPVLFRHPANDSIMVATTKLSQFVTGRYVPKHGWRAIWGMILQWLEPGVSFAPLQWAQTVRPTYTRDALLPATAQRDAIMRGINWHYTAKMLVHDAWRHEPNEYNAYHPVGPAPEATKPVGDGKYGLMEGTHSNIDSTNGRQNIRWWRRTDVNGESALAFALHSLIGGDEHGKTVAANLADWVYLKGGLLNKGAPSDGKFGLLYWAPDHRTSFYQDNDIKAILGCIGTAAILKTDRWDEAIVRNILGNFRTTGKKGFRGSALADPALTNNGWYHYWKQDFTNFHPHFEAWIWSAYLWLYSQTGYQPLLTRTRRAITLTMQAYPDGWRWTNGFQQERGRMLLPLAWLVRVSDTPQHRAWLKQIATDMQEDQVTCGAITEELGLPGRGMYAPPTSNAAYGTNEASLIQQNGDPLADMLYTCNFAFLGLHEAYAATGDDLYLKMEDRLAEFFIRIQVSSNNHPELDGAWYRAFDYELWDYWGSNADHGWGAWSVECGWTQGWIITVLALRELNLNLWDLTKTSEIEKVFDSLLDQMMPVEMIPRH